MSHWYKAWSQSCLGGRLIPLVLASAHGVDSANTRRTASSSNDRTNMLESPMTSNRNNMSPILPIRILRPNPYLEIAFDVRTRNAVYVLEELQPTLSSSPAGRRPHFYEETLLPEVYRSRPFHYKHSGFDRGHLAPSADFEGAMRKTTYNLCNVSPQDSIMNRTIWSQLEDWIRKVAQRYHTPQTTTYVVTGPLWLPVQQVGGRDSKVFQYGHLGLGRPPSLVAVPTHFFKVVVVVEKEEQKIQQFACFVVPNAEPPPNKTLQDYVVSWSDLVAVSGLQFFPNFVETDAWKAWADHLTHDTVLRHLSSRGLLTDGRPPSKRPKGSLSSSISSLQHLCRGGTCKQPPPP